MQTIAIRGAAHLAARPCRPTRGGRRLVRVCAQAGKTESGEGLGGRWGRAGPGWRVLAPLHWVVGSPLSPRPADVVDDNIGAYCTLEEGAKRPKRELTLGEKEQLFLQAMAVRVAGVAAAAPRKGRGGLLCHAPPAPRGCRHQHPHAMQHAAAVVELAAHRLAAAAAATPQLLVRRPPPPTPASLPPQSFYYEDKPMLSNEEFDNLKDELQWEGSKVVILT